MDAEVEGYFRAEAREDSEVLSIFSTYKDNLRNLHPSTVRAFENFLVTDPDYYYNQICGLISEGAKGRVYSGWSHITDADYDALELPHVFVVDFGYGGDPTAVIEVKWQDDRRYVRELIYDTGLDSLDLARRMRALGITEKELLIADYGNGGSLRIAELRRGIHDGLVFNVRSTVKGSGSINAGIAKVKARHLFMTDSSVNGWNEYMSYRWMLDANKRPTDQPMDADNHIMDCVRYFELCKGIFF